MPLPSDGLRAPEAKSCGRSIGEPPYEMACAQPVPCPEHHARTVSTGTAINGAVARLLELDVEDKYRSEAVAALREYDALRRASASLPAWTCGEGHLKRYLSCLECVAIFKAEMAPIWAQLSDEPRPSKASAVRHDPAEILANIEGQPTQSSDGSSMHVRISAHDYMRIVDILRGLRTGSAPPGESERKRWSAIMRNWAHWTRECTESLAQADMATIADGHSRACAFDDVADVLQENNARPYSWQDKQSSPCAGPGYATKESIAEQRAEIMAYDFEAGPKARPVPCLHGIGDDAHGRCKACGTVVARLVTSDASPGFAKPCLVKGCNLGADHHMGAGHRDVDGLALPRPGLVSGEGQPEDEALTVGCPMCEVLPGVVCMTASGVRREGPHQSRSKKAHERARESASAPPRAPEPRAQNSDESRTSDEKLNDSEVPIARASAPSIAPDLPNASVACLCSPDDQEEWCPHHGRLEYLRAEYTRLRRDEVARTESADSSGVAEIDWREELVIFREAIEAPRAGNDAAIAAFERVAMLLGDFGVRDFAKMVTPKVKP